MNNPLGDFIEQKRKEKEWSFRKMAQHSHGLVSHTTISDIESGVTDNPGLKAICGIALALNIDPLKLLRIYQGKDPDDDMKASLPKELEDAIVNLLSVLPPNIKERAIKQAIKIKEGRQA